MAEKKERSMAALAAMQIASGGSAGFVEICIMHPLDLIKTRFQIQRGPEDPNRYKSLADCFVRMYRTEGFSSFYKGILPPILVETPKRATKFFTFEQYKRAFSFGGTAPDWLKFSLAGLCSGLTEAIVVNPFEVVKVKLQAEMNIPLKDQKSAAAVAREIMRTHGVRGFGLGLPATLGRHGVWNMIYFGFYHNVKNLFPPATDPTAEFSRKFAIGFTAGTIASIANIPFDVAKSRIQGPQPEPGVIKYKKLMPAITTVYKEEGFLALYKGLVPKIMRLGPGGAIMLIVFDAVYEKLQTIF